MERLTLIIPVFNGSKYLEETFRDLDVFVAKNPDIFEHIIFVNDGSTDSTQEKLSELKRLYSRLPTIVFGYEQNKGKVYAVKYALESCQSVSTFVGFTDIELPYGLDLLTEVLEKLETYDMVVGSRAVHSTPQYTNYRRVMGILFRFLLPASIREYEDTQCGFKFFKSSVAKELFGRIKTFRWVFDIELFIIAKIKQKKIFELPVSIKTKCLKQNGGVSLLRHGLYVLQDLQTVYKCTAQKKYE